MARLVALLALLLPLLASAMELTAHRAVELRGNLRAKASEAQEPEAPEAEGTQLASALDGEEEEEDAFEDKAPLVLSANQDQNDEKVEAHEDAETKAANGAGVTTGESMPSLSSFNAAAEAAHDEAEDEDADDFDLIGYEHEEDEEEGATSHEAFDNEEFPDQDVSLLELSHGHYGQHTKKTALNRTAEDAVDEDEDLETEELLRDSEEDADDEDLDNMHFDDPDDGEEEVDDDEDASFVELSHSHNGRHTKKSVFSKAAAQHDDDGEPMDDGEDAAEANEESGADVDEVLNLAEKEDVADGEAGEHEDMEDAAADGEGEESDEKELAADDELDGGVTLASNKEGAKAASKAADLDDDQQME